MAATPPVAIPFPYTIEDVQITSCPLYVHPNENPSVILVSPPLSEKNFHSWSRSMKMSLLTKNKLGFVDGTIPDPGEAHALYPYWQRCNTMVLGWLIRSMNPEIAQSILWREKAIEVWSELKERFSQADLFRISELQEEIYNLKQGDLSVTKYFTAMKILIDELEVLKPIPSCNCSALAKIKEDRNSDHVIRFLRGLSDQFSGVRSQIMLMESLPTLNRVFQLAAQQERQFSVENVPKVLLSNATGMNDTQRQHRGDNGQAPRYGTGSGNNGSGNNGSGNSQYNGNSGGYRGNSRKECSYCGRIGHTVDVCYKKHGYPQSSRSKSYNGNKQSGSGKQVNMAMGSNFDQDNGDEGTNGSHDDHSAFKLTEDQYNSLLSLLPAQDMETSRIAKVNFAPTAKTSIVAQHNSVQIPVKNGKFKFFQLIMDTGATDHVSCSLEIFVSYRRIKPVKVQLPNGSFLVAHFSGTVHFTDSFYLVDVLYLPEFQFNLISVTKLVDTLNCKLSFDSTMCLIQDTPALKMIGQARRFDGLYYLISPGMCTPHVASLTQASASCFSAISSSTLWHFRLGHPSYERLRLLGDSFPFISCTQDHNCDTCHLAKQKKLSFSHSESVSNKAFELIHVDIWGPSPVTSMHGHRYFLTIVDDFTRFTWIFLMKTKAEVQTLLPQFCKMIETQFETHVKKVRSDNGPEFFLTQFYSSQGIIHQRVCVETPQQNSIVERKHQDLLNVARALLFQSHMPKVFWSHAVSHAVFLINRLPTTALKQKSPFELLFSKLPDFSFLKIFGSLCYASSLNRARTKLDPRARQCVFLGFQNGTKGYLVFDLKSRELLLSRHVIFHENVFPFHNLHHTLDHKPVEELPLPTSLGTSHIDFTTPEINLNPPPHPNSPLPTSAPHPVRHSTRIRKIPSHLQEYQLSLPSSLVASQSSSQALLSGIKHPISSVLSYASYSPKHLAFATNVSTLVEPKTYAQASKCPKWQAAMTQELEALARTNTWTLVPLPPHKKAIGCKWVFRIKHKADGTVDRYKARLVAKGYTQVEGIDYLDTFSPVAKMTTLRLLLALASSQNWFLHQLDVDNAFLHGSLDEEIYMKPPPGLTLPDPDHVCFLQKSLYGLKQASRQWYNTLVSALKEIGFSQCPHDHTLLTKSAPSSFTALLLYVDDVVLTGNCLTTINEVKSFLHQKFRIKDIGELKFFLGLEVARSSKGILLTQRKYALELLTDAGLLACRPISTPMDSNLHLSSTGGTHISDISSYRRLIGRLLYLTTTRPDINFAVQQLSQFLASPTEIHMQAANRILRYVKSAPGKGLFFSASSPMKLQAYSDSDWASCPDTRRSVTGFSVFLGSSLLSWKTKKQHTVSRSSSEAEYRAMAAAACEVQWFAYVFEFLKLHLPLPVPLFCDNQSAIYIAQNHTFHERTKHIELDCHVVRDKLKSGLLHLLPVSTHAQLADVFTKPLPPSTFPSFVSKLGLYDIHTPACGGVIQDRKFVK